MSTVKKIGVMVVGDYESGTLISFAKQKGPVMSKGNSVVKVLRTALHRVQKGWTQGTWMIRNPKTGKVSVCLEGAVYGYCNVNKHGATKEQEEAIRLLNEIIAERYSLMEYGAIPRFNDDPDRTKEEVEEVTKLALIRAETSGGDDEASNDEDFDNLLEFMDSKGS